MKTTYKLQVASLPGVSTRDRVENGWGERCLNKYRRVLFLSVWASTNKNVEETARIMGWNVDKLTAYLEKVNYLLKSSSIEAL